MAHYRALVHATGPGFLLTSFLARLPAAMAPLGVITLVVAATGSYAVAGAVAAAYGVGAAIGGPVVGSLVDRFGQRSVGLVTAVVDAAALVGVVVMVHSTVAVAVAAAVAGFATPQIGPLVRVRWWVLLGDRGQGRTLGTALSYEGVADELSYMAGPAIVGLITVTGPAGLPLVVAAGLTLLFAIPFALHHTAPPVVRVPFAGPARPRLPLGPLTILVLAMLAVGMVFGATQTGVTAFADESGHPGSAGLIYAVLGVGSALAGLATGWLPARIGPVRRYVCAAAALAVGGCSAMLLSGSLAGLLVAIAVLGVTSAPYLIAVGGLAILAGPRNRAGSVMTLVASGVVAGVAVGAAVAGRLADALGASGAFIVPAAAGLFAVALAAASGRLLQARAHAPSAPVPPSSTRAPLAGTTVG
ncbi:MFS transporter [Plantactinospora soyae]|uniref:MFS family permease n=1 Tax=Plantactinospora soyae TaxID=1544732 RepID=A0A927MBH2_9ACTN|nr:MFS transporter [Plantactinospora soyae]MBE1490647.1 MFS family permease [Plantactinospora soyae]